MQVLCLHSVQFGYLHMQLPSLHAQMRNICIWKPVEQHMEAKLTEFSKLGSRPGLTTLPCSILAVFLPSNYLKETDNLTGVQASGYWCHLYPRDKWRNLSAKKKNLQLHLFLSKGFFLFFPEGNSCGLLSVWSTVTSLWTSSLRKCLICLFLQAVASICRRLSCTGNKMIVQ